MATFEESLQSLERIVEELERPGVPLERALTLFEAGIEHLRLAHGELTRAEESVQVLVARAGGVLAVQDLDG